MSLNGSCRSRRRGRCAASAARGAMRARGPSMAPATSSFLAAVRSSRLPPTAATKWRTAMAGRPVTRDSDAAYRRPLRLVPHPLHLNFIVPAAIAINRSLYERARDVGGTLLTTTAIPFSDADWRYQYGPTWKIFSGWKMRRSRRGAATAKPRHNRRSRRATDPDCALACHSATLIVASLVGAGANYRHLMNPVASTTAFLWSHALFRSFCA
jgi:hypothetical protein